MAYIAAADFREATPAEYCSGLALTTAEASDATLGSAIARLSQRFDDLTSDHFESETLTLELDGDGTTRILLPRRCTALTTVKTRDQAGTLTLQASTAYRLHSSLDSTGSKRIYGSLDWIDLVPLSGGLVSTVDGPYGWPCGPQTVQVVGTFGWTTCPTDVKRAVALMVYDHFKPISDQTRRAEGWVINGISYTRSVTGTGLPEVDAVIDDYRRDTDLPIA